MGELANFSFFSSGFSNNIFLNFLFHEELIGILNLWQVFILIIITIDFYLVLLVVILSLIFIWRCVVGYYIFHLNFTCFLSQLRRLWSLVEKGKHKSRISTRQVLKTPITLISFTLSYYFTHSWGRGYDFMPFLGASNRRK